MKMINEEDLKNLALGAALLGSGGGGNPAYDLMMARQSFEDYGPVYSVSLEDIEDEAWVAPIAFMGAPLVGIERLPSGREYHALFNVLKQEMKKEPAYFVAAEIGGANAFSPLLAGACVGLPVIDGDMLGRAFPELQMSSCTLFGISAGPAVLSDCLGRTVIVEARSAQDLEVNCRKICIEMGSSCALTAYVMRGKDAKKTLISGTLSYAMRLGKAACCPTPIAALLEVSGGRVLGEGMIVDIDQRIEAGFLKGTFQIVQEGKEPLLIYYQNEYLAVYERGQLIASTPEILIPVEKETAKPVTSESLQYGIRAVLLALPSPELWSTPEGMALVGPSYFKIKERI